MAQRTSVKLEVLEPRARQMDHSIQPSRAVRFGVFEVDFQARELRKRGLRLKLQEKPFQILEMLVARPGEVVTREELRAKLWPGIYAGFDRSLNTAVNALRQVLGDSSVNPRFVETRARRGYRFIAPVEVSGATARAFVNGEVLDSIAVLPFENAGGDPEMEYLIDGIAESIINSLSQLSHVRVLARSAVLRYKGQQHDPQAIARYLNVRTVLTGRVVPRGEALSISTELIDAQTGWQLWGEQYHRTLADICAVKEEISREISEKLRLRLSGDKTQRLAKRHAEDAGAYQDYLKGCYFLGKATVEGLWKGIGHFEEAIGKDPNYALAYAGQANGYGLLALFGLLPPTEVMPHAKELAMTALRIDDNLAEAHASLAGLRKAYDWDWAGAEHEYRRALELNSNYAAARRWYADYLSALGRSQEAIAEIQRALQLDPLSLVINMALGWNLYMAREYDRAAEQSLRTLDMEPGFEPAQLTLGLAYQQMGDFKAAINAFEKAREGSGDNPATVAALGCAHAVGGKKREAAKALAKLERRSERAYVAPYWPAIICAGLGDTSRALEWLQRAHQERDVWLVWLKVEPRLDSLRPEPRFQKLLERVGLAASSPVPSSSTP